jgi:putative multiple sugar transport system substrate-binding protein
MKKVLLIILAIVMAFGLLCIVGCDDSGGKLIGVAMPTKSLQRWNQDGANLKEKLEEAGYKVDLQYADNSTETQIKQIENMITKGAKVLVIASIDGESLKNQLEDAGKEGIKVIAYDRLITGSENVDYYATFDNYKVGQLQGEYIINTLDLENAEGPFNIELFAGSPDDNNAKFFNKGAMDQIQKHIDSGKLVVTSGQTEFTQIAIQDWSTDNAFNRMQNLLTANYSDKKVDVVLSPNDSLAQGIAQACEEADYKPGEDFPLITGQDCDINSVKNILAGKQSMSIFKDTRVLADRVVTMVTQVMEDKEVEVNDKETYDNGIKVVPSYLCEPVFADKDNYKELLIDSGYYTEDQLK